MSFLNHTLFGLISTSLWRKVFFLLAGIGIVSCVAVVGVVILWLIDFSKTPDPEPTEEEAERYAKDPIAIRVPLYPLFGTLGIILVALATPVVICAIILISAIFVLLVFLIGKIPFALLWIAQNTPHWLGPPLFTAIIAAAGTGLFFFKEKHQLLVWSGRIKFCGGMFVGGCAKDSGCHSGSWRVDFACGCCLPMCAGLGQCE